MPDTNSEPMVESSPAAEGLPPMVSEEPDEESSSPETGVTAEPEAPGGEGEPQSTATQETETPSEAPQPGMTLQEVQRQLELEKARTVQLQGEVQQRTQAYDGWKSAAQGAIAETERRIVDEAKRDEFLAGQLQAQASDSEAWLDIISTPEKFQAWDNARKELDRREGTRQQELQMLQQRRFHLGQMEQAENVRESDRVFNNIDALRKQAGISDDEWDALLAEYGRVTDAAGNITRGAFHYLGNDWALIEKTATDVIRGRHAPQAVKDAGKLATKEAEAQFTGKMARMLPGSGTVAAAGGKEHPDVEFARKIVAYKDTEHYNDVDD